MDQRLAVERRIKYKGTAIIRLDVLDFPCDESRELDPKNVERLKKCFRTEGCHRLKIENHIPAIIEDSALDNALRASGKSRDELLSQAEERYVELDFSAGYRLACLHGQHRIQAGREYLSQRDAWWTVDLYLADVSKKLRTSLVEEYANQTPPSDGEIYYKFRLYDRERSFWFKNRWRAFLSKYGRRCLDQVIERDSLASAIDALVAIPGLRPGLRLSTLSKAISKKCDEQILHALGNIHSFWYGLFSGNLTAVQKVDQAAVRALELKAPKFSIRDAQAIEGQIRSGQILSAFTAEERHTIWGLLRSFDGLVPSLSTFSEDVKYLLACADCMRQLVAAPPDKTIYKALDDVFHYEDPPTGKIILQETESSFATRPGTANDCFELGYRQLWLYAMRHYPELPKRPKKNKTLLAKPGNAAADEVVLREFAILAKRLRFRCPRIDELIGRSPDREIARVALLKARRSDRYAYDDTVFEECVDEIVRWFSRARPLTSEKTSPSLVSEDPNASGNRCGFPNQECHDADRNSLFLTDLHRVEEPRAPGITSFFVRRSVYFAFFGRSESINWENLSDIESLPNTAEETEQDRLAQLEREIQAQLERERLAQLERERMAREERERTAQEECERLAQEERDQIAQEERERLARVERDRIAQEEQRRMEELEREREMQIQERREEERPQLIRIDFSIRERRVWRTADSIMVDPKDPSVIERIATKYMRKHIRLFDKELYPLTPEGCFQAAIAGGSNVIYLIPEAEIDIGQENVSSIHEMPPNSRKKGRQL